MKQKQNKVTKSRIRTSYITAVISIALVLFLLGLEGLLLLTAQKTSKFVQENFGFTVILNENIKDADMHMLQKSLEAMKQTKSTNFITKEQAAEELQEDLGEDFIDFLGYNPLNSLIDVVLHPEYTHPDSVMHFESMLSAMPEVKEVRYEKDLLHKMYDNIQTISLYLLGFCALLFIIVVALINNTIRLAVYSKRFLIRTMQLVGATRNFIRMPFILGSALQGIISAFFALLLISGFIYMVQREFSGVIKNQDFELLGILFVSIIIVGIVITSISTYFAVNKYLNIKSDELYI